MSISKNITPAQIHSALESISQRFVVCYHDEANGYAFKHQNGEWGKARFEFVHDIANSYEANGKLRSFNFIQGW